MVRVIGSLEKARVREIGGEIIEPECRANPRETRFGSKYREAQETEGSRNRDFTVEYVGLVIELIMYILADESA